MKPILFNTKMVQAIIDGRKTVTRRVVKPQPAPTAQIQLANERFVWSFWKDVDQHLMKAPYDRGDILYVRETFCVGKIECGELPDGREALYVSQGTEDDDCIPKEYTIRYGINTDDVVWKPSIHMPKAAARIFLRVTDVRVERLQDMAEEDAFAEGYKDCNPWCYHLVHEDYPDSPIPCFAASSDECPTDPPCNHSIPELFGVEVWNTTIKKTDLDRYGWDANPWVWVIEFRRIGREEAMEVDL